MNKGTVIFCVLLCLAVHAKRVPVDNDGIAGCNGQFNDKPVVDVEPQLLATTSNGEKYLYEDGKNYVYLIKVAGTPYEMGHAIGELFKEEIAINAKQMYVYLGQQLEKTLSDIGIPLSFIEMLKPIALNLFNWALDLNWQIAEPYTPRRYDEELHGIADGSNGKVDYDTLRRINMLPELTQAACTIVGAWGPATKDGKLLQLRALDWSSDAPVNQFPLIVIYNSSEAGSTLFANVGYAGLVGSITAISKAGVGIAEKVWYPPKGLKPRPRITYFGKPWTFVLRDMAQFATNIDELLQEIYETKRTMRIHLGLGSFADNSFRGIDYSSNVVDVFTDTNYTAYSPQHPQMDGIFYFDKHTQPSNDQCVGNILKMNYGNITPETLFREVAGFHQSGNTQMCAMDLTSGEIWLSYSEFGTNVDAYKRSAIHVKLYDFWGSDNE